MRFLNSSGYNDPTAGQALANIRREERRREKQKRRKMNDRISGAGQHNCGTGREGLQVAMEEAMELERFFHSGWYSMLTDADPDYLITKLRKDVVKDDR